LDDRRRDGGTNSTLRIKKQGTHLNLNEHDDDDDDDISYFVKQYNSNNVSGLILSITFLNKSESTDYVAQSKWKFII
jgi:hypothetical protein